MDLNNLTQQNLDELRKVAFAAASKLSARIGGRQQLLDEAEMIVTDILTGLRRTNGKYDPSRGTSLTTYVYNITRYRLLDFIRSKKRNDERFEQIDAQSEFRLQSPRSKAMTTEELGYFGQDFFDIFLDSSDCLRSLMAIVLQDPESFRCASGVLHYKNTPICKFLMSRGVTRRRATKMQQRLEELFV